METTSSLSAETLIPDPSSLFPEPDRSKEKTKMGAKKSDETSGGVILGGSLADLEAWKKSLPEKRGATPRRWFKEKGYTEPFEAWARRVGYAPSSRSNNSTKGTRRRRRTAQQDRTAAWFVPKAPEATDDRSAVLGDIEAKMSHARKEIAKLRSHVSQWEELLSALDMLSSAVESGGLDLEAARDYISNPVSLIDDKDKLPGVVRAADAIQELRNESKSSSGNVKAPKVRKAV